MRRAAWLAALLGLAGAGVARAGDPVPPPASPPVSRAPPLPEEVAAAAALRSPDLAKRRDAAYRLWNIGERAKPFLAEIAAALRDDDEYVRSTADKILATFRMEKSFGALEAVIPDLLPALADSRVEVRRLAAGNLWRAGWPSKPPPPALLPALVKALSDPDAKVRASAAAVIANFAGFAQDAFPALKPLLSDPDADVRLWSVQAYGALRPAEAAADLTKALADPDARVRAAAAGGMQLGDPGPIGAAALGKALADPDKDVRIAAAGAFGSLRLGADAPAVREALRVLLKDADPALRVAAAFGLEGLGASGAIPTLTAILASSEEPADLRAAAASTLGALGPEDVPKVLEALQDALQDGEESVRQAAASSLGTLGRAAAAAAPGLIGVMRDALESVRGVAASALGRIGASTEEVVERLTDLLRDSAVSVRNAAAEALLEIGGGRAGTTAAALEALRKERDDGTRMALVRLCLAAPVPPPDVASAADPPGLGHLNVAAEFARVRTGTSEVAAAAVAKLVKALEVEETRWPALFALGRIGAGAAPAVPAIEKLRAEGVTKDLAYMGTYEVPLLRIPGPHAAAALERALAALRKGDVWAAMSLGEADAAGAPAAPDLAAAAGSKDARLCEAADVALGRIGVVSDAVKAALEAARKDPLFRIRRAAYDAQSRLGLLAK